MHTKDKVIIAADELGRDELLNLAKKIGHKVYCIKIHNLFDKFGSKIVADLREAGAERVWVDFKLHDIPNTVRLRAKTLAESGCDIITVHASGGVEMMKAAQEGFEKKVFGVTALTSLDDAAVKNIYGASSAAELVIRLASLVKEAGIAGLVCSPKELERLRADKDYDILELAVPGIRSVGADTHDQKRFDTPGNALRAGASYLVVGRQITQSANALKAIEDLEEEIIGIN